MTGQPMRLLVVEDSEDDALLLRSELKRANGDVVFLRVDSAATLRTALMAAEWDVVISDHSLPGFSSLEALQVISEFGKDIPFIIYSGVVSEHVAVAAMYSGAHDAIPKGNVARLLAAIEREMSGAATRRAKEKADVEVHKLAFYDSLTGLPNRNLFCSFVERQLGRARAHGPAVYVLDVDRFLRINGFFGHKAGDQLIRQIGQRLQESVPEDGMVARLGSDDFAVFVPATHDEAGAREVARAMLRAFAPPFLHGTLEFCMSVSIGMALGCSGGGDCAAELLANAETAMFRAKELGGNGCQLFLREMGTVMGEQLLLESALRKAVQRGELLLEYQPNLDVASGSITGVEALVRWNHPELGLLAPDQFIPLANESGLITEIGKWVLLQACRQCKAWHDAGYPGLTVAVNVSAVQFWQPGLVLVVRSVLAETGIDPSCVELEITESVLMRDVESTVKALRALKDMAVKISVDDFGAGYSSLNYLRRFPVDILKIDRSFASDVMRDAEAAAIVRAVGDLGRSLGLVTVAEGVETDEQLDFFHQQRYDRVQGFVYSRPRAATVISEMLASGLVDPLGRPDERRPYRAPGSGFVGRIATSECAQQAAQKRTESYSLRTRAT
jgi:diguanylate cyclase (GGDEF)-like protein